VSPILRATLALLVAAIVVTTGFLARWQYGRHQDRVARNAVYLEGRALPPVDLAAAGTDTMSLDGRRLVATGRFDPSGEMLLRGRVRGASPGLHVATPLLLAGGGGVVWVERGFVAAPDATTPTGTVPPPDTGVVRVTGVGMAVPVTDDAGQPLVRGTDTTWRRLDRTVLATRRVGSLPTYLLLEGDAGGPGRLPTVEPPALDEGPHFSYAVQWIGIGLAALAFGIIALRPRGGPGRPPPLAAP
jgi:cytochrome oxidase assembly protein ShyY1